MAECGKATFTRDQWWTPGLIAIIAAALSWQDAPLCGKASATYTALFSSGMATRAGPTFAMASSCSCQLRGSNQAATLKTKLGKPPDGELCAEWTVANLAQWLEDGLLSAAQHEDVTWGLAAAAILNKGNKNDCLRDRMELLRTGRFHRSHFPPEFFKARDPCDKDSRVLKNDSEWRSTSAADAIRTPLQMREHAVRRQMNLGHASLYPPTLIEVEALQAAAANQRAQRVAKAANDIEIAAAASAAQPNDK